MYFKEFLTEVRTGDLIAFNKAIEQGVFSQASDGFVSEWRAITQFFRDRGYRTVGEGFYATVMQSTDHFIVKIADGDRGYNQYVELARRERNPHFPRVIAQKQVGDTDVYFIERLYPFHDVPAEEFIKHHTKKDAPMFLWLAYNFLNSDNPRSARYMIQAANGLDPSLKLEDVQKHPGYEDDKQVEQYWTNIHAHVRELEGKIDKGNYNHPFLRAVEQIEKIRESTDIHTGNIMIRKPPFQLVITDPLAG